MVVGGAGPAVAGKFAEVPLAVRSAAATYEAAKASAAAGELTTAWQEGSGGNRLIVGGGRAGKTPNGVFGSRPGDVTMNLPGSGADPHIQGSIQSIDPARLGRFNEVYFEHFPHDQLNAAAAKNAASVLGPGGKLRIVTGSRATVQEIKGILEGAGFRDVTSRPVPSASGASQNIEFTAVKGG